MSMHSATTMLDTMSNGNFKVSIGHDTSHVETTDSQSAFDTADSSRPDIMYCRHTQHYTVFSRTQAPETAPRSPACWSILERLWLKKVSTSGHTVGASRATLLKSICRILLIEHWPFPLSPSVWSVSMSAGIHFRDGRRCQENVEASADADDSYDTCLSFSSLLR